MIEGFEEQTHEVDSEEEKIAKWIIPRLKKSIGESRAVTNQKICTHLKKNGFSTSPPRVRKIIHNIRVKGLVPNLIATSRGYYVTADREELSSYVRSLQQRINSITEVRDALVQQLNTCL